MKTYCAFHPERPSRGAKGFCETCYKRIRRNENPALRLAARLQKKRWYAQHPEKQKAEKRRWRKKYRERINEYKKHQRHRQTYGVELSAVQELDKQQDFRCKICNVERKLVTDHNHTTGKFRGRICDFCNHGLGNFMDDPKLLLKAVEYLSS